MKVLNSKYKNWNIYYAGNDEEGNLLGKSIIDQKYNIKKILKDGKRNFVAVIEIKNKNYILKEIKSEIIIPQRKIQTFFKKGEALSTLCNGLEAIEAGIHELVLPITAVVKKKIFIEKSYILMEYINGEKLTNERDVDKVIEIIKKVHAVNRYHGDLNTSNFIKIGSKIKMLDTQMKKEKWSWFKKNYDILTLKEDLLVLELKYDIEKNYKIKKLRISFMLAYLIKKIKKSKIINILRKYKKELREKGYRI